MTRRFLLLGLIVLAFGLRLHHLDVQSLWYDEGVTAQGAQLGVGELARWTADDIQPPLYYLLMNGWLRLFHPWPGNIAYLMRWLSAAFGLLLIPLLWAMGKRLWHERAGWLAALLAAISPLMVYYGQEARMYTLLLALTSLAALAVLHVMAEQAPGPRATDRWWGVYALAALAALYTHYFAVFALAALMLYVGHVWWRTGRRPALLLRAFGANALVGLGFLPWLPAMLHRYRVDSSYWSGTLKIGEALLDMAMNFSVGATEVMLEQEARVWLLGFGVIVLALLPMVWQHPRRGQRPLIFLLLGFALPVIGILALAYRTPKFNARYLMIAWPAWALFVGAGLSAYWGETITVVRQPLGWMPQKVRRSLFVIIAVFLVSSQAVGLQHWFGDANFAKAGWREAISEMYFNRQPDEAALLVSGHAYPIFDTYLPPDLAVPRYRLPEIDILDVRQVVGWEEAAARLNQMAAQYGGVWLFLWQDDVIDPSHVTQTLLDRYALVQPTPSFAYIGLRHYRFRPHSSFPAHPPAFDTPADFGQQLRLVGAEAAPSEIWLYWQALQAPLPDLKMAVSVRRSNGELLLSQDLRPAGYTFPTSHWQAGETYIGRLLLAPPTTAQHLSLEIRVYEAATQKVVGVQRRFLTVDENLSRCGCE